jgi:hypothetical protein
MSVYHKQLSRPQWQKKRLQLFKRAGWQCEKCGSKSRTLHLHHPKYVKGRKPWEYNDLKVWCSRCHHRHHFPPLTTFVYGEFYRVRTGRLRGITAVAWSHNAGCGLPYTGHVLFSWDFPGDGCISWLGCLGEVRRATKGEELEFRRAFGNPPTEM